MSPRWGATVRLTDCLTVSRNVTLTLTVVWPGVVEGIRLSVWLENSVTARL
jgi:hypothetical protein